MRDQVWWVTGASSGIGAALARGLSARGARLILVASLRRSDPDALFDWMSAIVQAGYAQQMKAQS